ncbi:hypothetical protein [Lactiplantibacillus fabifermentans]|uniref:Uncharacterized protein n=2 Tax=Lactiplantibacillus fabifermentans TaxID=483011 RepID=A0A0R2NMM9_9LACO|nr:hypothetical protein [Lactiplantibacillus fabifermentans]ETY72853.1 hypothetical protein LFAB_15530 [Lactiplantibacillus fabifermentans T30PCM01]KRO26991.1 hypothetical protein DY78_GL000426 [Lactiplantibacillus fabifermentans DSM 21115]
MIVLDLFLAYLVIRNVVIESRLMYRAKYRFGQIIVAALLVMWGATGGLANFEELLFYSLFMLVSIMMGNGGLTNDKLVIPGSWIKRTVTFSEISGIQISAIPMLNEKAQVIVKFVLNSHREINMIFQGTVTTVQQALRARVGQNISIEVSKFE